MDEDIVRQIFKVYLEKRERKPIKIRSKHAAGPDFRVNGWDYECKGTEFDEKGLFNQLVSYASESAVVNLVMPWDALKSFDFIWKLEAIEKFIKRDPHDERSIGIYLIAEIEEKKYAICNFHHARSLNNAISSILYKLIPSFTQISSIEEKEQKIIKFLNRMEDKIREEFRELVIQKAKEAEEAKKIWDGAIIEI
jgi:hypothetical protein